MRSRKRRILIDEATGDKERLQADQIRLVRTREEYHRFSEAAGLREQWERAEAAGFSRKHDKAATGAYKQSQTEGAVQLFKLNSDYRSKDGAFDIDRARKEYADFLTTVPKKNRILLEQSFGSVGYEQAKLRAASFGYSIRRDTILYDPSGGGFWELDFIVANTHELAHRIDCFFVRSDGNAAFDEAIQKARSIIDADPNRFCRYCKLHDADGFLSDICSAISYDAYDFPAGHPTDYWRGPGNQAREIFANLFSLETFGDDRKLDFVRDNFPDIFNTYRSLHYEVI